jgi:hypothetical protein
MFERPEQSMESAITPEFLSEQVSLPREVPKGTRGNKNGVIRLIDMRKARIYLKKI